MTLTLKMFSSALPAVDPGVGGVINKVLYGEAPPGGSNPYSSIYSFLPKWYPFYIPRAKLHPFCYTSSISQNNRISYNRHVFPRFSVVLIQLRNHFCKNVARFDILRFSKHFVLFAADFVTLLYTKMAIFPTL